MHPDLSPHLHTEECNKAIDALHKCYKEETFGKFSINCGSLYKQMTVCLKQEREIYRKKNADKAKVRQERILKSLEEKKAAGTLEG